MYQKNLYTAYKLRVAYADKFTLKPLKRSIQAANTILEWSLSGSQNIAHVIEFPKCGGSWVRNMIRCYRDTELFLNDRLLRKNEVIMHHRLFSRRFKKPIVVVRDPRDLYVSFYHYQTSYKNQLPHSPLPGHFNHDPRRSIQDNFYEYLEAKLLHLTHPWFFYSQFLDSWLNRPQVCVLRYEDIRNDPEAQLLRMIRFLKDPVDLARIDATVQKTSFEAITEEKYASSRKPGETDNTKFHRKGMSGDWKNHFNERACRLIEKVEGSSLRRLGYETDSTWIAEFVDGG